jgi:PAS domain S-box-containing protein
MTILVPDGENVDVVFVGTDRALPADALELVASAGYRLVWATDAADALGKVLASASDLLICDIEQSDVDGYVLCQHAKGQTALRDIRVLLLTSSTHPLDPERAMHSRVDSFLQKPFDAQTLIKRLDQLRRRPQSLGAAGEGRVGPAGIDDRAAGVARGRELPARDRLRASVDHAARVEAVLHRQEVALTRSNEVLNTLYRIAQALNRATCEADVLEMALDRALELPGVRAGWIQILDDDASFRLCAARNLPPALLEPGAFAGICECKRRVLAGEHGQVGGVIECGRLANTGGDTQGLRFHASIPLWLGDQRALGLMNLVGPDQGLFKQSELEVLYNVGNQVAVALERVRLHEKLEQRVRERTADLEQEIDERKRVERNQARLIAIIEATPDMVATSRADGTPLYCNPAGRRMLGLGVDEDLAEVTPYSRHWASILREQAIPHAQAHGSWSGETALLRPDGLEIPLSQVIIAHRGEDGDVEYLSTIARDIAEQKHNLDTLKLMASELRDTNRALENERTHLAQRVDERTAALTAANAELEAARLAAEQASRVKSAFLATMSHEIRTPMNGVIGMIDVLAESALSDDQRDLVNTARQSGNALLGIINDILDFSKIEAEQLELERAPVALFDLTEGVCNALLPVASSKGVALSLFIAPALAPMILADDVRLRQILFNLLGNAIKFSSGQSPGQGRVGLRLTMADAGEPNMTFEISDNGIGMSQATMAELFTPFKQAEITTTRRFGGTGLGLTICKRLVDRMGGSIAVRSKPQQGSVFTVTLPIEVLPDAPSRDLPDVSGLTCAILEDSSIQANDLRAYLEFSGAGVQLVATVDVLRQKVNGLANASEGLVVISRAGALSDAERIALAQRPGICHLLIGFGRRKRCRIDGECTVSVDGDALRQVDLLRAVAVAAGRASPEVFHDRQHTPLTAGAAAPSIATARAQGRLILVAEDDKVNQLVIQRQLALLGFAVEIAGNGVQALQMWQNGSYGLILSDQHMPEMDGLELTRIIRDQEGGQRRVPIIILSANALRGETARAKAQGADDYLTKPVPLSLLKVTLEQWLPHAEEPPLGQAAGSASPGEAAVDVDVLRGLVGSDPAVLRDFLGEYLDVARRHAGALREAMSNSDARNMRAIAHKLKSASRSVGAMALGDLCAQLERAGELTDLAELARIMVIFESTMALVDAEIVHWLAQST